MLASGLIAAVAGIFLFVQGWRWSQRAYSRGASGPLGGDRASRAGSMILGAFALAGVVILLLVFYVN